MKNFTKYHLHTDLSNPNMMDSTSKFIMYLDKAVEYGMSAIAFSEHGNIYEWVHKKLECEARGLKYIHGVEMFLTETLNEKVRDNYHIGLYAKNGDGVNEINKLVSIASNKDDNHFYFKPRISLGELFNTSENVIVTTACMASILHHKMNDIAVIENFMVWASKNSDRVFLEIQPHIDPDQIIYNKFLYELSKKYKVRLIAGSDTHNLDANYAKSRSVMQKGKKIEYSNEDNFNLNFHSYDEFLQLFKIQNALDEDVYLDAIQNTNVLADMVEEFKLDRSHKYPKLYENYDEEFKKRVNDGVKNRKIDKKENKKEYYNVIRDEYKTYETCKSIDYMLLMTDVLDMCRKKNINFGYGRGSVNGSEIAYNLGITEMDSVKHNLNFFRFMNPQRISLCDIDVDFPPSRRQEVIEWLFNHPKIHTYGIITFNTIAKRGAIEDLSRGLGIPLDEVDKIKDSIDTKAEDLYKNKYPELFELLPYTEGTITSVGYHPSGYLVSPHDINDTIGYFVSGDYKVSQCNMKELDYLNYVKLDILGLANIEIIDLACEMAGIERLTPDNVDVEDDAVWDNIQKSPVGIFQFESDSSHHFLRQILRKEVIARIKNAVPSAKRINLMCDMNAVIRPSCDSFREDYINGNVFDNGNEAINEFLSETLGRCIYQEQIMLFLNKFCGYSQAESDTVRRGIAKKSGTEDLLPEIEQRFIKFMNSTYGTDVEKLKTDIKSFLQVVLDASAYGFSTNHSMPYTYIGYNAGYLRTYHTIEFITAGLIVNEGKQDKTAKFVEYMSHYTDIKINPIKFGKSKATYFPDKITNTIYKGIASISYMNKQIADELYELRNNEYSTFIDLLNDISTKTSCDKRQIEILINLEFFSEYGKPKRLTGIYNLHKKLSGKKQMNIEKANELGIYEIIQRHSRPLKTGGKVFMGVDMENLLLELSEQIPNEDLTLLEKIQYQKDYLGYIEISTGEEDDKNKLYILSLSTKNSPKLQAYSIGTGKIQDFKIQKKKFAKSKFDEGCMINAMRFAQKPKYIFLGNDAGGKPQFDRSTTDKEWWIEDYKIVK